MDAISITALASFFSDEPKSLQRGENHYKSDHVEKFDYFPGELRGVVRASMKDKSYNVVVQLGEKSITSSRCDCPRGQYKCSHAATLIIFGIHNISRTDVECQWRKKKGPATVKSVDEMYPPPKDYNPLTRSITDDDRNWLQNELKTCGQFTGMYWLLSPEPDVQPLPVPSVEELILSPAFLQENLNVDFLLDKLKISVEQQQAVKRATKGQRHNPVWHQLRKGRLTASNFGVVLKAKRVTPSLIKRLTGTYNLSGVQSINWGVIQEEEGIKALEAAKQCEVVDSGLWLSRSGVLGASPDGLVGEDAIVEVKCPFTQRNATIAEAVEKKDFYIKKNEEGSYKLQETHQYWHQVQGQLHLTRRDLCYFVVWTTKEALILNIERDASWIDNLEYLENFHREEILPRLLGANE